MRLNPLFSVLAATVLLSSSSLSSPSPSSLVKVALRSSWPAPPFLLELIESAALENPSSFFHLLTTLTNPKHIPSAQFPQTPEAIHAFSLPYIGTHLAGGEEGTFALFEKNLALHSAVPKIEAFFRYYVGSGLEARVRARGEGGAAEGECASWVDWYGEVVCDLETLKKVVGEVRQINAESPPPPRQRPKILPFDHIHPSPASLSTLSSDIDTPDRDADTPVETYTAILYASSSSLLSNTNFRDMHMYLLGLCSPSSSRTSSDFDAPGTQRDTEREPGGRGPRIEYILRWVPPSRRGGSVISGSVEDARKEEEEEIKKTYLSGYGVSLDVKKMDYLALDDRHQLGSSFPEKAPEKENEIENGREEDPIQLLLLNKYPSNPSALDASIHLSEDEVSQLGLKCTHLLYTAAQTSSSDPSVAVLRTLTHLSQNFPKYATSLARRIGTTTSSSSASDDPNSTNENATPIPGPSLDQIEQEILSNHIKAAPGVNMVWINGVGVDERDMNPYALLRILRKERTLMHTLTSLSLSRKHAIELLTHSALAASFSSQGGNNKAGGVVDAMYDASDRVEGGGVVVWWNDIEKDKRYERWKPSIHAILRPLYPGQFPSVKLNLFNIILVLDLSQASSLNFIATTVSTIISRDFPFRFGVVPSLVGGDQGIHMARLFYYLIENYGRATTMGYLKTISQVQTAGQNPRSTIDWALVRSEFSALTATQPPRHEGASVDFDAIVDGTLEEMEAYVDLNKIHAYMNRLRVNSPSGHAFVNGKHFDMDDLFLRNLQLEVGQQLQFLQEAVYSGQLTEENPEAASVFFYDLPTTNLRRNQHIYPSSSAGSPQFFNVPQILSQAGISSPSAFIHPRSVPRANTDQESEQGASPPPLPSVPFTVYVVADLDSEAGLELVKEALKSVREDSLARVAFIHNPSNNTAKNHRVSLLMSHLSKNDALSNVSPTQLLQALDLDDIAGVDGNGAQTVLSQERAFNQITGGVDISVEGHEAYMRSSRLLAREFRIKSGDQAIVVNGRVVGPIGLGEFDAADFEALLSYELRKRTGPVVEALVSINPVVAQYDQDVFTQLVSMASSILSASQVPDPSEAGLFDTTPRPRQRNYRYMSGNYTAFEIGDITTALYQVGVLLDPLSEAAQKWSPLMEWLSTFPDVFIDLHINPSFYTEVPLKRFYRYNVVSGLTFDADGSEHQSQAVFDGLPVDPIYTLGMDVPPAWLVRPREAMYDLDNIQLGVLSPEDRIKGMQAVFDLDFLVVEGHARNSHSNAPPRGVQLQLKDGNNASVDDTQVVATLGYFQFKTTPGVFQLEIREGRGRQIYKLESVGNEGWDSLTVTEVGNEITLTSFEGLTLYPRLIRNPGMEAEDVLADVDVAVEESPSVIADIVSRVSSFLMPKQQVDLIPTSSPQADINIFTVASGLLYERFVSIMILSVLRNTNSSVKFWFIENFLSPSFLEFIPHLAEAYGFQYELVTYKWPSWLRPQKEKQRIIWAYKILFLDVLFPMDLKKVIFVDADQIVRADLQELVDLDLHGAPYGYTPMGDDNTDMEGFRFWKTGYWKEFLQGRPYHISALYVIDLVKFRQVAAGDILRQQYQGLSADPNSLANLDQDLPNNLQREIPIYSLHEDWLWCETWCSKDRLHRAKTIDLCQNPLTKEPKLARARAIPEWEEYDSEIARFARKLAEEGLIQSNVAAVDVNVLANAGSSPRSDGGSEKEVVEQTDDSERPGRDEL